mmetsp:Transcript_35813/g.86455  ORF Transcript_35813/g.86455 Transcript_35813/m.86455 type:complete len:225 (+) Transcript_35813:271-945(+)
MRSLVSASLEYTLITPLLASLSTVAPVPSFLNSLIVAPPLPMIAGIILSETSIEITFELNCSIFLTTRPLARSIKQRLHFMMSSGGPSFKLFLSKVRNTPSASGLSTVRALLKDLSNSLIPAPDLQSSSLFIKESATICSSTSSFSKSILSISAMAPSTFSEVPMMRRVHLSTPFLDTSTTNPYCSLMLLILVPVFPSNRGDSLPASKRDCETIWIAPISFLAF